MPPRFRAIAADTPPLIRHYAIRHYDSELCRRRFHDYDTDDEFAAALRRYAIDYAILLAIFALCCQIAFLMRDMPLIVAAFAMFRAFHFAMLPPAYAAMPYAAAMI